MIVLFTDFGSHDPYVGQVKARLHELAPTQQVVDLLHEAPDYNAHAGAHLIAALAQPFPPGTVFVCVVDPGVGGERDGLILTAGGHWFVGPDNGLLSIVGARRRSTSAHDAKWWRIRHDARTVAPTFHGRDVFAPLAARIANGDFPFDTVCETCGPRVEFDPGELARVIYLDHFGNAWTGVRAANLPHTTRVRVAGREFAYAETFSKVEKGSGFWFVNSVGLLEIAANRSHAAREFGLEVGSRVEIVQPAGRLN